MNVGVIGVGGVGGYFGGKLAKFQEQDASQDLKVYFVARNKHLEEIRRKGLILSTAEGEQICRPTLATDDFDDLPALDLCLLCFTLLEERRQIGFARVLSDVNVFNFSDER